jgi:DNA-3-methyladenine glycosylase II
VRGAYRLDLTATVLRRLSTNLVDVFDGTTYRRVLARGGRFALLEVTQPSAQLLSARATGDLVLDVAEVTRRMLGVDVNLSGFYAGARDIPWLDRIVTAARGVRPPRYPSLWEAIVNAVIFQQISIHAAAAILRRVIERYEVVLDAGGVALAPFPPPLIIAEADPPDLRAVGLSINKIVALRTLARAVLDGELDESRLDTLPTTELVSALATFKGIGPWTAAVIALRGFGRLDVFPLNDSGVARGLRELAGVAEVDVATLLAHLGPQRGMLYYHLLIGRLAARGEISLDRQPLVIEERTRDSPF